MGETPQNLWIGPADGDAASQVARLRASQSRVFLSFVLGPSERRATLFAPNLRDDCLIVARLGADYAGFASVKIGGHGPLAPNIVDFFKVYGFWRYFAAWSVFRLAEASSRASGLYIYHFEVDPAARRHGVGMALLRAIVQMAASRGISSVELDVAETNVAAAALYSRFGFEPAPRRFSLGTWLHRLLPGATRHRRLLYRLERFPT